MFDIEIFDVIIAVILLSACISLSLFLIKDVTIDLYNQTANNYIVLKSSIEASPENKVLYNQFSGKFKPGEVIASIMVLDDPVKLKVKGTEINIDIAYKPKLIEAANNIWQLIKGQSYVTVRKEGDYIVIE